MNKKGFTLIELLVVVAIIGILAAVGVVAYNGYTSSAKRSATMSNHKSLIKFFTAEINKCVIEGKVRLLTGINNQGITTTNKGNTKSLILKIIFLSSTKASINTVLNLATSEG